MNRPCPVLAQPATQLLLDYHWPGNVRELENSCERALLMAHGAEVTPADFPFQLHPSSDGSGQKLEDVERHHIEIVLQQTNFNLSRTARILDIDRTTLYNKIKKYGLRR